MAWNVYEEVTARIVAELEQGTVPWLKPWKNGKHGSAVEPHNAATGRPYHGINWVLLQLPTFGSYGWLTFKQARELGGSVKKGEKGSMVVYWSRIEKEDKETGEKKSVMFAKAYTVFNVEQCEGLEERRLKAPTKPVVGETELNLIAEQVGARVQHGGDRAFFSPDADFVQMPSADQFKNMDNYRATLAHELCHWTGHKDRLARDFSGRFGSKAYAFEELIAELGSAFVCARLGIELEGLQHSSYLASWLEVLKEDKRAIFTAASAAQKASEWLKLEQVEELEAA